MTDYCISAVRYDKDDKHIELVKLHKDYGSSVGDEMVCARAFVADLISTHNVSFQTIVPQVKGGWLDGSPIHVVDDVYLSTDANSTKRDNLGSLQRF
ncbi:DUF3892 domain-containing protein [Pseudomonas syringae group genomosp. 7]|uniref:DUF3892 domain-containing protein n=1 Tax=Pseudomonas syringae group genomosp. 7 TaxID=251699 RepID=UPI000EFAD1A3|nr:DUF3892 domain-containing protein [Pseudomonas syringae group genomosp. 7]